MQVVELLESGIESFVLLKFYYPSSIFERR